MTEFCPDTSVSEDFFTSLNKRAARDRIPVAGSLELTRRCNFQCIHCYLPSDEKTDELTTEQVLSVIDQITDAGCLFLLFTGGEPLLRADFPDIYEYAVKKGLLISVFTNGSLLSDEIISLFKQYPPQVVDVTVYGATEETNNAVTGVQNALHKTLAGIERLLDAGIRVKMKTVIMKSNFQEIRDIERMADEYEVPFRMDAAIFSRLDGDKAPVELRVSPEDAVSLELTSEKRRDNWIKAYERSKNIQTDSRLFSCGAGVTSFHIDSRGMLQPCIMTPYIEFDLKKGLFVDGWRNICDIIKTKNSPSEYVCSGCDKQALCGSCPGYSFFENGEETEPSDYLCSLGHLRYKYIYKGSDDAN